MGKKQIENIRNKECERQKKGKQTFIKFEDNNEKVQNFLQSNIQVQTLKCSQFFGAGMMMMILRSDRHFSLT